MSLAPYYYRPLTPPESAAAGQRQRQRGHARNVSNVSNASSYYTNDTSPESVVTNNTTPSRSPLLRQNGPTLLPKIRTQDSCLDPSSAGRTKNAHRRALSVANNPPATTGNTRPPMYRSATEPVECTSLISPVSNASYSRASSVNPSPGLTHANLHRTMKAHSRSGSASSIDSSILNRFGYPTYRQMPVYLTQSQQQTPSPVLYPQAYLPYHSVSMLEPPMINLEGTFDMPIDLETISRPASLSPPPQPILAGPPVETSSLLTYLTQPTQPINLVRHLTSQPGRGMSSHFWWDIRNVRPWTSFSLSEFSTIPDLMTLLNFQHDVGSLPAYTPTSSSNLQTVTPSNESDLATLITKIHFPRANASALLSLGGPNAINLYAAPNPGPSSQSSNSNPSFLANYPSDGDRTLTGLPRGRIVGLAKSFDKWNTGMRREGPARKVEYLRGLAHLQKCMRDHSCRYGFIVTEIELVCVRAGCDARGMPFFGYVEVAEAIATKTNVHSSSPPAPYHDNTHFDINVDVDNMGARHLAELPMTATLALYFLLMLAKSTPLPGQPGSFMDVGGPGALTRQRVWDGSDVVDEEERGKEGRDKWIPEPQVGEKREARTVRGWVWPSDPWHKREGGGGKRRVG